MKTLLLTLGMVLLSATCFTQDSVAGRPVTLNAVVFQPGIRFPTKGYLVDINDTAVFLMQTPARFRDIYNVTTTQVPYSRIESITFYRKGTNGRGVLIGAVTGGIAGAVIASAATQPCHDCFESMRPAAIIIGSMLGTASGSLIGLLISEFTKKTFRVKGKHHRFDAMKLSVLERAYR
ncbi:MAG TPA: hypothetical protein VD993_03185 [Chitinophagaceae bacterium]|nr:hypothetical protein [Chitinophagaceae bacterium]